MRLTCLPWVALLLLVSAAPAHAGALLKPEPAPEWEISEWLNGDPGQLADQRGRVVVIEFFQLWCPGCRAFSIPLFNTWAEKYRDRDDVLVVSIHTVFEGHDFQTPERLEEFIEIWGIDHPVGIDAHATPDAERPVTMTRFRTGGTPHVAIVDKQGQLRFSHFGAFDADVVERFIERLALETDDAPTRAKSSAANARPEAPRERSASRRPTRPNPRPGERAAAARDKAKQKDKDSEGEDRDDDENGASGGIPGNYTVTFAQTEKSCGTTLAPKDLDVTLVLRGGKITARFAENFMGFRTLLGDVDENTGTFSSRLQRRTRAGGDAVTLDFELQGQFDLSADPTVFEYTVSVDKTSADGAWDCSVVGEGAGVHK